MRAAALCETVCLVFSDNICSGPLQATFTPSLHHHYWHQLTNVSINCFFSQHLSFGTTSNTTQRFSLRSGQDVAAAVSGVLTTAGPRSCADHRHISRQCPLPPRAAAGRRLSWWAAAGVTSNETTSTLLLLENCRGMSILSQKPTLHSWEMSCPSDPTQINNVFKFSNILMVLCTLHTP